MSELRAPFPWTGGKRRVADVVWRGLGSPPNYIEPFFGSGAVLLSRPHGAGKIETVNDIDGGIVNFWRAMKWAPRATAKWCDWPVSELDLHARHAWLIERLAVMREELRADPYFFDAQVAGWWVWGICQWIGTGWCGGIKRGHPRPNLNQGQGVHAPGVWEPRPHVSGSSAGMGVHKRQLPRISVTDGAPGESGVLGRNLPGIGNDRGINGVAAPPALDWFRALSERLRRVRVVCGDWHRVLGDSVLGKGANVGGRKPTAVFFDPPYDPELRNPRIYTEDAPFTSREVREWCLEHGNDPDLRICLAGYWDEHREHMPSTWTPHRWKGARGYAGADNDNREQETLWFSPHCLPIEQQRSLFDLGPTTQGAAE